MKPVILLLGTSTLALAGTSAFFWQEVREERARNEAVQARVAELESRLQNLAHPMEPPPPPPMAQLPPAMPAPPMAPPPPASRTETESVPTFGRMDPGAFMARERERMQNPEYRALRREQQKMGMLRMYSDLGMALDLSDEDVDKVIGLLAEHQLDGAPPYSPGESPTDAQRAEWARQMQERQRKKEAGLRELLGDTKYQEWEDYERSMGARMQARNLRSILEGTSEPLREDQYKSLVTAIAAEQRNDLEAQNDLFRNRPPGPLTQAEQMTLMEQSLERTAQQNERMRDAAAPYLSTAQLERYDKMLNQQLEMQRLNLKMMRARGESGAMVQTFMSDGATIVTSQGGTISQTIISQGSAVAVPAPPKP